MGKLLLTGVDGNLGETAAEILLSLELKENLIFCGYSEEALKKYADMGVETRQTNFNNANNTRDIIDNQNNNARAILDALTAQRIEAKDAKIAEQNQQLFAAQLAASQASQNETLKAYMQGQFTYYNPRPVPAFPVSAPYQYGNCGCNTGCGC